MKTLRQTGFWVGVLTAVAVAGVPWVASAGEAHGGGGGGGGAHFSGGGGGAHFSGGGGGAHFSGGGRAGFAPRASFGGTRPTFAAPHAYYGAGAHYAASANHVYGGYPAGGARIAGSSHFAARPGGITPSRAGFVRPGTVGHGFVRGSGRFWGGGYWGGRFWPGCHYGPGFAWFLPVLPFGYATYYWGGNPYYYYDGGYYSWNPDYNGYVATDPPPVADTASSSGSDEAPPPADDGQSQSYDVQPQTYEAQPPSNPNTITASPPPASAPALSTAQSTAPRGNWSGGVSDIVAYPRNGQTDQQTSNDKFECHKWSVAQTGFDPTRSINLQGTAADYRRAMGACMDARGYTVR